MMPTQRLPPSLTPLDVALAALLQRVEPVAPTALPLAEALGRVAAGMPPLEAFPPRDIAASDGFALCARDLVGASSYSPLPLMRPPVWVEAGDPMPEGCDCVVDASCIDQTGPIAEALVEAIPGQGVRRIGGDIAEGRSVVSSGQRIGRVDLLSARVAGLKGIRARHPRLRLVDIPANSSLGHTALLIFELAGAAGASPTWVEASGRDAASIAKAIEPGDCDLLVTIGGSGVGHTDAAIAALVACGADIAHGIALQPGRTAAVGRIGKIPVVALPGAPDQALAAWWTLALPVLDRLSGLLQRQSFTLPLSRKIASSVGLAEIVLLKESAGAWTPLAVGELSLDLIARADAWLVVPGASEGFAAGTPVNAYLLQDLI
jgi:molybdopterin molybdotransferase